MKPIRLYTSPNRLRPVARRLLLVFALLSLSLPSFAKVKRATASPRADIPSGFLPGTINYFAGNGTESNSVFPSGSVPTNVSLTAGFTATDGYGNVYIAGGSGISQGIYMVYGGGTVPAALANVTTNATPSSTPQAGRIYQIAGFTSTCGACEGMPLDQVGFVAINGVVIDSQNNLYYSDGDDNGDGEVVRRVDEATSNVTTVAGQWDVAGSPSFDGDGGPAVSGALFYPLNIVLDTWGNLYINDSYDDLVRVVYLGTQPPPLLAAEGISATANQQGYIYSVAGLIGNFCTTPGPPCEDGGLATATGLGYQYSIGIDAAGNLYVADQTFTPGPYIRLVYAGGAVPPMLNLYLNPNGGSNTSPTGGYIYPVTGYAANPQYGPCISAGCGDGGLASQTIFGNGNLNIAADALGNVYISDDNAHAIRKIDTSNYASTIAGIDNPAQTPPAVIPVPAGGAAVGTYLNAPYAISFDSKDNLYIQDSQLVWIVAPLLPQTIDFPAFTPSTVTYGVEPITLAATASSGLNVQYTVTSTPSGIAQLNGAQLVIDGAGTINVTATQSGNNSYAAAPPLAHTLTVNQAPLTVTANAASKVAGAANPAFSATITGFVNGDTATTPGVYTGAPAFTTMATANSPVGAYPIVPSIGTLKSTNYSFPATNFIDGTLTITGNQAQTITFLPFSPGSVSYGQAPVTLNATASSGGPVSFIVVSGPGVASGKNGSILTITGAGTIVVQAVQEGYGDYAAAAPVSRTLTVSPAQLTVTGPTVKTSYGTTINPGSFPPATITGFVGSDTEGSVLTGAAQYTTATGTPNAGSYPIAVGLGTLTLLPSASANYTFGIPVNGTLIVQPATQTIQFNPVPSGQIYGNILSLTAVSSSGLPVTFTASGPALFYNGLNSSLELSGVGSVVVTATQAGSGNYIAAQPVSQTISVGPAPLTIGLAQAYSREEGAPNPTFQFMIQGFVLSDTDIPSVISGVPLMTTSATPSSPPGVYPIVLSQGTLTAPNYYFIFVNGTLTVTPAGSITLAASPSSLTIQSGLSGQSTLTITPNNFYQGMVTLSCGSVPANVTCTISPSTYNFPGNQAPAGVAPIENNAYGTITINASGTPVAGAFAPGGFLTRAGLLWLIPGGISVWLLGAARRRARRARIFGIVAAFAMATIALTATSCGGSSKTSNAAPGATQIMIQASGTSVSGTGSVTSSFPLIVTVQ